MKRCFQRQGFDSGKLRDVNHVNKMQKDTRVPRGKREEDKDEEEK